MSSEPNPEASETLESSAAESSIAPGPDVEAPMAQESTPPATEGSTVLDPELEALDADALFKKGEELRKLEGLENAALCMKCFQRAVEKKVKVVGNDVHPELAEFYFAYSDALLAHQEAKTSDMESEESQESGAEGDGGGGGDGEGGEGGGDDDEQEDLEIVWECLETARLCFAAYKDDALPASASDTPAEQLKKDGLYRIHMRLGDVLCESQNWADASTEFARALDLAREKHGNGSVNLVAPLYQLLAARANNKTLSKTSAESAKFVQECRDLVNAELASGDIPADKRERREMLLEELGSYEIQCKPAPGEAQENSGEQPVYQLGTLVPVEEQYTHTDGNVYTRRRVDLTPFYANAA